MTGRATYAIATITAAISLLVLAFDQLPVAAVQFGFIPLRFDAAAAGVHGFWLPALLTPLGATVIHGGVAHLVLNTVMLVFCGVAVERIIGLWGVVLLYLVGAYAAAAGHWLLDPMSAVPMIGASGAISALAGAYALLFGENRARAVGPIPASAVHVAWLAAAWIGIQLLVGFAGMRGGSPIAIGAHIGGFIVGLALAKPLLAWRWRGA